MSPWLASVLGYDPLRVAEMPPSHQRSLALAALAAGPALFLLGVSAAYGAWLASDMIWLAVAVGLAAGLYLLNLLRVAVAGGGVGPQQPLATITTFAPRTVPLLMLALLGAFFAQPLTLGLLAGEQDPEVEVFRQRLGAAHQTSVLAQADDPKGKAAATEVQVYREHLARSHFLLKRVQLTWERPLRALLLSLAMVVLMVLPWLASATVARSASRSYEARRWKANRAIIDAAYRQARLAEAQALIEWPTFEGPRLELHEDAPYNTKLRAGAGVFEARHG